MWGELPIVDPILQFTVLVTVALIVQLTFERLHQPGLLGLLIIGMLLGPGGMAILPREPVVDLLGQIGLIYVMFVAALEIDLDVVYAHQRETAVFGLLAFGCSLMPALATGLFLGYPLHAAILVGTLLSSHTLLAYPIVQRLGLLGRRAVVTAIGGTLLTDTLALVLLAITIQSAGLDRHGGAGAWSWLVPLVLLAVLVIISLWSVPRLSRFFLKRVWIRPAEKALFVLVILVLLSSVAEVIGTEEILGAFLAGLCLNRELNQHENIRDHIEFVGRMLFIPFFFVSTGMLLELDVFTGSPAVWLLAGIFLVLVVAGKTSASWLTAKIYGYSLRELLLMTGLTVPQAAATLAVTVTAREAELFGDDVVDAVIILIFVTCFIGPLMTRYAGKRLLEGSG